MSVAVIGIILIIVVAAVGAGLYFTLGGKPGGSTTSQTTTLGTTQGTTAQSTTGGTTQTTQSSQTTQSTASGGGPNGVIVNFYDILGNFSSFTMEYRYNSSSGGGIINSTLVVTGTTTVNGAKAYVVNVTQSSGIPPVEQPSASLVINSSGMVTSFVTQGQTYNGSSATFGDAYLSFWAGVTAESTLYSSLQNQGTSTVSIGAAQFQVVTYSGSITSGPTTVDYDLKYGTVVGHQLTIIVLYYTSIPSSGYDKYQLLCASLYGQATCPPS